MQIVNAEKDWLTDWLIDKIVEKCSEDINGNEMIHNVTLYDHKKVCRSCSLCIVLLIIAFITIMIISSVCFHFYWYSKKDYISTSLY